jgi:hypothetical protein
MGSTVFRSGVSTEGERSSIQKGQETPEEGTTMFRPDSRGRMVIQIKGDSTEPSDSSNRGEYTGAPTESTSSAATDSAPATVQEESQLGGPDVGEFNSIQPNTEFTTDTEKMPALQPPPKIETVEDVVRYATNTFNHINWDLLPKEVMSDKQKKEAQGVFDRAFPLMDLEVPREGLFGEPRLGIKSPQGVVDGTLEAVRSMSADTLKLMSVARMYKKYTISRDIDYRNGITDTWVRARITAANTKAEKKKILEEIYGEASVTQDNQGRLLYRSPETGMETSINDEGEWSFGDLGPALVHTPELVFTLGAAMATGGMSVYHQLAWTIGAAAFGRGVPDAIHYAIGDNLETQDEVLKRMALHSAVDTAFFYTGWGVGGAVNLLKNPYGGGITEESVEQLAYLNKINYIRASQDLDDIPVRLSSVNEAPFLSRIESILSQVTGGASVYFKRDKELDRILRDEVKILMKGYDDLPIQTRATLARKLIVKLRKIVKGYKEKSYDAYGARYTGVDPRTGSAIATEGQVVALKTFRMNSEALSNTVHAHAGTDPFITPSTFKAKVQELLDRIIKNEDGTINAFLNGGISESKLTSLIQLKDRMNFIDAQSVRMQIGEMMRGNAPIGDATQGQLKELYKTITADMERGALQLTRLNPNSPRVWNRARFWQTWKDFREYYKINHKIFNEEGGTFFKILQHDKNNPEHIVDMFLRVGNEHHWPNIKKWVSPQQWQDIAASAKQALLSTNKSGTALLNKMDALGDKTMATILGGMKEVNLWRKFGTWQERAADSALRRFLKESQEASALFSSTFANSQSPAAAIEARRLLGRTSPEWKKIQLAHAARLITKSSDARGKLNASELFENLGGDHKKFNDMLFEGSRLGENLNMVAAIGSSAARAQGGSAGGLAAGMYIIQLFTGHILSAATAGAAGYGTAKVLTSKNAQAWFTNTPIGNTGKKWMTAAIQEYMRIAAAKDDEDHVYNADVR